MRMRDLPPEISLNDALVHCNLAVSVVVPLSFPNYGKSYLSVSKNDHVFN